MLSFFALKKKKKKTACEIWVFGSLLRKSWALGLIDVLTGMKIERT